MFAEIFVTSGAPVVDALPYTGKVDPVKFTVLNPLSIVPALVLSDPEIVTRSDA